ncbi:MAG: divergent PAP2 family protein [Clostridia bacterium]
MTLIFGDSLYYNLIFFITITIVFTWLITQTFKVLLKCWIGKKFSIKMFFADGDFPSTHTALVTCSVILILFLNAYTFDITDMSIVAQYNSAKDFLIILTLASIVIRDAMGQRHRQDNTNRNLKNLKDYIQEMGVERNVIEHIDATFQSIDNEAIKRVGHLKHEVYGGMLLGALCALYPIIFFFDRYDWLLIAIIATLVYFSSIMLFLKLKPVVLKKMTYRKKKHN